jgi:hypothetical protein
MVVAALLAAPAYAQGTSRGVTTGAAGWGALDGSVRDESGEWLRDVEVFPLDEPEIHTRSGPGGAFRIDSIPAGVHRIRFRRLGVVALTVTVTVRPGTITTVDAVVDQTSVALGRVTVEARGGELSDLPPAVLGRIHRGAGRYVTAADIRHQAPTSTAEIFRSVPGITVVGAPGREMLLDAHADAQFHIDPDNQGHITYLAPCPDGMAVYIDGAPAGARGALSSLAPKDIAAIEIYENPSEIPATLGASQCGTVYIWTR